MSPFSPAGAGAHSVGVGLLICWLLLTTEPLDARSRAISAITRAASDTALKIMELREELFGVMVSPFRTHYGKTHLCTTFTKK